MHREVHPRTRFVNMFTYEWELERRAAATNRFSNSFRIIDLKKQESFSSLFGSNKLATCYVVLLSAASSTTNRKRYTIFLENSTLGVKVISPSVV